MNGLIEPVWFDSCLDIEVEMDQLVAWVARTLPQYTIPDLKRMKAYKFFRLTWEAEKRHKDDLKRLRGK